MKLLTKVLDTEIMARGSNANGDKNMEITSITELCETGISWKRH